MASTTKISIPIPKDEIKECFQWRDWFQKLSDKVYGTLAAQDAINVDIGGGLIDGTPIGTRVTSSGWFSSLRVPLTGYLYGHGAGSNVTASTTIPYTDISGGPSLVKNYGAWHDLSTQTATSTTVVYPVQIGGVLDYVSNFSIVTGVNGPTQITAVNAGLYNFQYSLQLTNPTASISNTTVWWRQNGVDLVNTSSTVGIMAKHGSLDGLAILSMNVFLHLSAGDNVEMFWQSDVAGCKIITIPASTSPVNPVSPGVIVTVLEVK